ncbi:MAG: thioredoxin domain-containing protein, partial [candidate division NC10 bacterium]|nr:thioredoxin domain-containing protein [candidate division NC10 bacterium]
VDREERPDIDKIYMDVCHMMTGSGGWPLTILMTFEKKPFFAGTYLPKESRFGRTGMMELISSVREVWCSRREEVFEAAEKAVVALRGACKDLPGEEMGEEILRAGYDQLAQSFDGRYGGFGSAPKFPLPQPLLFLLRYWKRTREDHALGMVEKTLAAMRRGGIYDQVGFGFHRYSTDRQWLLPHFEKMLYDQALLAIAYTEAYQATGKEEYEGTAREIFSYVLRELKDSEGGFYSAEDADSEGEEGKFYLWTEDEIRSLLDPEEAEILILAYGVQRKGNFGEPMSGERTGKNILHLARPLAEVASELGREEAELNGCLESAREKLFAFRRERIPPLKDDKILADWNGLMIAALAKGAQALEEPAYVEAAGGAADFILGRMRRPDGRLLHRYREGAAGLPSHLDDYAFLIWGMIELYEATFQVRHLEGALELTDHLFRYYWDEEGGGFYFTADDGEMLLSRRKEIYDGALPSGNSVAMWNLLRLGRMTANPDWEAKAARIGQAFSRQVQRSPSSHAQLLVALDFAMGPSSEVVIVGKSGAEDTRAMGQALRRRFLPRTAILHRPSEEESPPIVRISPSLKDLSSIQGKAAAYLCSGGACQPPTTEIAELLRLLEGV